MSITIKQPDTYVDFAAPDWVEPYDHTLVSCDCGNLMERGMGLCNECIERESLLMQSGLENMARKWKDEKSQTCNMDRSSSNTFSVRNPFACRTN